jgi:hypothetical protein
VTGPEHYREAERLIALAEENWTHDEAEHDAVLRNAQVHATLALAAATVDQTASRGAGDTTHDWRQVVGLA